LAPDCTLQLLALVPFGEDEDEWLATAQSLIEHMGARLPFHVMLCLSSDEFTTEDMSLETVLGNAR